MIGSDRSGAATGEPGLLRGRPEIRSVSRRRRRAGLEPKPSAVTGRSHRRQRSQKRQSDGRQDRRRCGEAADDAKACGASGSNEAGCRKAVCGGRTRRSRSSIFGRGVPAFESFPPERYLKEATRRDQLRTPLTEHRDPTGRIPNALWRASPRTASSKGGDDGGNVSAKQDARSRRS